MAEPNFDRQLLLALLALQNTLITEAQLLSAFRTWLLDKSRDVIDVLIDEGALTSSACDALKSLVNLHVLRHGDARRSLAMAQSLTNSLQLQLGALPDQDIQNSLPLIGAEGAESDRTSQHEQGSKRRDDAFEDTAESAEQLSLTLTVGGGTTAGRFRILRPHAQGGLGEVFVALDDELDREVALKQIRAKGADRPELRERFLREAEITGKLEHPGIVPVYGLGHDEAGRPYYAMRFVRGESLRDAIRSFHAADTKSTRSPSERNKEFRKLLGWFVDVCDAISYAHSRGVLHRDLKPANIMLGRYGETLVVDWGGLGPGENRGQQRGESRV